MMAPLATSWVVVLELSDDEATIAAYGPFSGDRARERAQTFGDVHAKDSDVLSVAVLPMRSQGPEKVPA